MFGRGRKDESPPAPRPAAQPPLSGSRVLPWRWDDLVSADGHTLQVTFGAAVEILTTPAERTMFRETFGDGPAVTWANIQSHFDAPLRHAANTVAATSNVEVALAEPRATWQTTLQKAATATAFSCGVQVQGPFTLEVSSPSLAASRAEQLRRQAAERRAAQRVQEVKQAGELLAQWEQLRVSNSTATPGQLLSQLPTESRGDVLRTLLLAERRSPTPLWCVAGPNLVRIDPTSETPAAELVALPPETAAVGPLRSVTANFECLLLGGQRGVIRVEAGKTTVYLHPDLQSDHGFTRAARGGNAVWAVHRDAGLVHWAIDQPNRPDRAWSPAELGGIPRHLVLNEEGHVFAVDQRLLWIDQRLAPHEIAKADAPLSSLLVTDHRMVAVGCDGRVAVYDAHGFSLQHTFDTGVGEAVSAALLPWLGSSRLLLAGGDGPILSTGLEDDVLTRYGGGPASYRAVAGAAGVVAGLSPDRQRILLWRAWDGRKPFAEVHVSAATRHRVADFCFADHTFQPNAV